MAANSTSFKPGPDSRRLIPNNTGKTYQPSFRMRLKMLADLPAGGIKDADGNVLELSNELMAAYKLLRDAKDDDLDPDERGRQLERFWNRYRGKPQENVRLSGSLAVESPEEQRAAIMANREQRLANLQKKFAEQGIEVEFTDITETKSGDSDSVNKELTP